MDHKQLKINISKETILNSLSVMLGMFGKKHTIPILSNLYIKQTQNNIIFIMGDSHMQITSKINYTGDNDYTTTVNAKKLHDALIACKNNITIMSNDSKINVQSNQSKFTLQSMESHGYPLLQLDEQPICTFTLDTKMLKQMVRKVQYAIAYKHSRICLNGMLLELKSNQLSLVATDAHRLALYQLPIEVNSVTQTIIPLKSVIELDRFLGSVLMGDSIQLSIYNAYVSFASNASELITKVIDAKFPNYERVIPSNCPNHFTVDRSLLLATVSTVAVIGSESITLNLSSGLLRLCCKNQDNEESYDELPVTYAQDDGYEFHLNIKYLQDALNHIDSPTIKWEFTNHKSSMRLFGSTENNYQIVIMPLRD